MSRLSKPQKRTYYYNKNEVVVFEDVVDLHKRKSNHTLTLGDGRIIDIRAGWKYVEIEE